MDEYDAIGEHIGHEIFITHGHYFALVPSDPSTGIGEYMGFYCVDCDNEFYRVDK